MEEADKLASKPNKAVERNERPIKRQTWEECSRACTYIAYDVRGGGRKLIKHSGRSAIQ